jgi:hypothetical protein
LIDGRKNQNFKFKNAKIYKFPSQKKKSKMKKKQESYKFVDQNQESFISLKTE